MFLLLSNPTSGVFFTLKTGISAGEIADLIDVYGEGAVHFTQGSIVFHGSEYGVASVIRNQFKVVLQRGSVADIKLFGLRRWIRDGVILSLRKASAGGM